ncbi:MAG TPA: non-homologous end-joining DNA ligase [Candidatus Limnocylindrales bacterium]
MPPPRATSPDDTEVEIGGRVVRLSNPARVLWPATGFTKGEMIDYYRAVAPTILPHLRGRGITLRRFPEGVDGPGWYQANCRGRPPWVSTQDVTGRGGETLSYCRIEDEASLVWVANLGTIEVHPFIGRADLPAEPTALVLDLDPGPPASLVACSRVALALRDVLAGHGLDSVVKTSGSVGMHVFAPLRPGYTFGATKAVARALARLLASREPQLVIDRVTRADRAGRVFIDWVQNDESRSTVAPYSLRATPWPLVSMPVTWREVEQAAATGDAGRLLFRPTDALRRIELHGDLFEPALRGGGILPDPAAIAADPS